MRRVGMPQLRCELRLAPEPRRRRLILPPPLLVHHLDHGHAPELEVPPLQPYIKETRRHEVTCPCCGHKTRAPIKDAAFPEAKFTSMAREGGFAKDIDCFLGLSWFAGRVWTFDYPCKTLWWRAAGDLPAHDKAHEVPLAFKKGAAFPRILVTIDGEELPLLFDTGAMVTLSPAAQQALGDGPAVRGGSFITTRTFDKWHARHLDWRVLADADQIGGHALRMIEVPAVTVGGFTVGPAWFAERPDKNLDQFMSGFMSAHVEGALGGSALHYVRVTVDYPHAVAVFDKP